MGRVSGLQALAPFTYSFHPGLALRTFSAEGVIMMMKVLWRGNWADIEGVLTGQSGELDWPYMETQLAPLSEAQLTTILFLASRFGYS